MRAFVVDAFTDQAFRGNPAGVVLLDAPADPSWMQSVAAELRHSETAFVNGTQLRWFTPSVEVELCGHATSPPRMCSPNAAVGRRSDSRRSAAS